MRFIKTGLFCALLFACLCLPHAAEAQAVNPLVRYDGLYQTVSESMPNTGETRRFLRFYPDGTVLSVTSTGTAADLKRWFGRAAKDVSRGRYELHGTRLYFSTTSKQGTVVYDGVTDDGYSLDLDSTSLINGNESRSRYYFIKMNGLP